MLSFVPFTILLAEMQLEKIKFFTELSSRAIVELFPVTRAFIYI